MKCLNYTMSLFKKAVKRNKPDKIFYDNISCELFFFTQKSVISYKSNNLKDYTYMRGWILLNHFDLVQWSFAK